MAHKGNDILFRHPHSEHTNGRHTAYMARTSSGDVLVVDGVARALDAQAAQFLRVEFPFTAPVPVLGRKCTIGLGDRLGLAAPGHIAAIRDYQATPVLVQQSLRELNLTGRTWQDILDAGTFMTFREGFTTGFGADGDHLKQPTDIKEVLSLGYTMVTLDCSEHIANDDGEDRVPADVADRYLGRTFSLDNGQSITLDRAQLASAVNIYGKALDFATDIWRTFWQEGAAKADFELSIDETTQPTTPQQHFFIANELTLRGVRMATMAPRFCGEFQKGINYIGDVAQFEREIDTHTAIARHFGYKLSVHSGSDKFSIFPLVGKYTQGRYHLKTAGTSWLEAMRLIARLQPQLYRQVHAWAVEHVQEARAYYHVNLDMARVPGLMELTDGDLPGLFDQDDARQLIHITYGVILKNPALHQALYQAWHDMDGKDSQPYADALRAHIGRHLEALGVPHK
ncbi:MAG: tagaturonate epimerase family protein [Christensenellales bacterium]|jgi:hypothetical protein